MTVLAAIFMSPLCGTVCTFPTMPRPLEPVGDGTSEPRESPRILHRGSNLFSLLAHDAKTP